MSVRSLEAHDVDAVLSIQSACPEIAQWSRADYDRAHTGELKGWVAERIAGSESLAPSVVGFVVARVISPEIEILNFAVAPGSRQHGVGTDLFDAALTWARTSGLKQAMLEVRAGNAAALRLYHRRNFQIVGRRPRYYSNPVDDALLLTAPLD